MSNGDSVYDVLVVGAGPAGLGLAAACCIAGLATACVAPDIDEPWENNFGVWLDEVDSDALRDTFNHIWGNTEIIIDEHRRIDLNRRYGQFNTAKLKAHFVQTRSSGTLDCIAARVNGVQHDKHQSRVDTSAGTVTARIVVDASGFKPVLLQRPGKKPDVWQVAYGIRANVEAHPFAVDKMVLMDFRAAFLGNQHRPATFLYVMPFSEQQIFVEETSMLARPGVSIKLLEERLYQRLASLDITVNDFDMEERCFIPMNPRIPNLKQRVLGSGAAAGFVHPGTGYSVSLSLRLAPQLAGFIAEKLHRGETNMDKLSREAWQQIIWPAQRRHLRLIYKGGMEAFNVMSVHQLRTFLSLFFRMPDDFWRGYLSNAVGIGDLVKGWKSGNSTVHHRV